MLTAKEIAERYAGQVVKCVVSKSTPIMDSKTRSPIKQFDGRIIGWKDATADDKNEYVLVEIKPPGTTHYLISHFRQGCHWTYTPIPYSSHGKRLLPEEVVISSGDKKTIEAYPNKCPECGSPALFLYTKIDCSNQQCKHKYKTTSGFDLFLPQNLQASITKPKAPHEIDKEGFLICQVCKERAISGMFDKTRTFKTSCKNGHTWSVKPEQGDKLVSRIKGRTRVYNGKAWITLKP